MRFIYTEAQITKLTEACIARMRQKTPHCTDAPPRLTDLIPHTLTNSMEKEVIADINELGLCLHHSTSRGVSLWTAASMMAFRILEDTARRTVYGDFDIDDAKMSLHQVLEELERVFTGDLVECLQELRQLRNEAMHGEARFSRKRALEIVRISMFVVLMLYSLET